MKRNMSCSRMPAPRRTPCWELADGNFARPLDFQRPRLRAAALPQPERGEACPSTEPLQACCPELPLTLLRVVTANVHGLLQLPHPTPRSQGYFRWRGHALHCQQALRLPLWLGSSLVGAHRTTRRHTRLCHPCPLEPLSRLPLASRYACRASHACLPDCGAIWSDPQVQV